MSKHRIILAALIALLALGLAGCVGSDAGKYVRDGNQEFAREAYEQAWAAYQAAQIEEPELAEPYYNAANALYRQGKYDEALEQMNQALAFADQEALAAQGYYNLGNTSYSLQNLPAAIEAYKQALLRDPDDQDAKHNLEVALLQQQQQQQNEEQQQQESQQQQNDQQNQDEGAGREGEQQSEEQPQGDQGQEEQQQQDQGQNEQQAEEGQEQPDEGQQPEDNQGEEEPAEIGQQQPGQDGQPDTTQAGQGEQTDLPPDQNQGFSMIPEPGQRLSADQARQLLAAIGRNSETLQQRLGQIFSGGNRPPAQDW